MWQDSIPQHNLENCAHVLDKRLTLAQVANLVSSLRSEGLIRKGQWLEYQLVAKKIPN